MIEAAMAVLVLAVGVVAVFMLFQSGLQRSGEAAADTQTALFADGVLNGLKAAAMTAAESTNATAWDDFWINLDSITLGATNIWMDSVPIATESIHTNIYRTDPFHDPTVTNVVNHALRYHLEVDNPVFSNRVDVTLRVWPGEFGPTADSNACVFYTEIRKPDQWQ